MHIHQARFSVHMVVICLEPGAFFLFMQNIHSECDIVCVSGREGVIKVKIVHDAGECLCVRDSISHL